MSTDKKRAIRPNLGGSLRPQADTPRRHFLYTDVTMAEHAKIQQHCAKRQISVSQFLAEIMLQEALKPRPRRKQKITVQPKLDLTPEHLDKLQLLVRLHQKESIGEFILEILQPYLEMQRLHTPVETSSLRYYLSEQEHAKVIKHVTTLGISARNYAALLAIRAIDNEPQGVEPQTAPDSFAAVSRSQ
jgi:hypothetical protein